MIISRRLWMALFAASLFALGSNSQCPPGNGTPDPNGNDNGTANDNDNSPMGLSFAGDVLPIFTANCASCHQAGGEADMNGIAVRLTSAEAYATTVNQQSVQDPSWTIVKPGDSAQSLLYLKISQVNPPIGARMPRLRPPLSATQQQTIKDWIDGGALNN